MFAAIEMKITVFFLDIIVLASQAFAWSHVDSEFTQEGLIAKDFTLVASSLQREHSQALESEWLSIQQKDQNDNLISVDCSTTPKLCKELNVRSFPTIRLYHQDGRVNRYRGPRKAASIKGFMRRSLRPAVSQVDDKNITSFTSIDDVVFIGHIPASDQLVERFRTVAEKYRDRYSFAIAGKRSAASVECHNNLDGLQHHLTADHLSTSSPSELEAFIKTCSTPLIPELTRRNEMSFYTTRKSLVHFFVGNDKERDTYVAEMRPLAKKYQEYLHFTTTDVNEYPNAAEMLGTRKGGLAVQNPNDGHTFPYTWDKPISAGTVERFLGDIVEGKVQPLGNKGGEGKLGPKGRSGHEEL
ncbi:hypothetical protein B0H66DRAFT_568848 [Apodospora peruviana]|uniref:Protein disulfide-isomerase n=1 Tax=Apodospora peruviana TaxID=516989 RepID=A0AAE0HTR5_9PEZI|nr:hypothetical protein B0H66DRAFT_568848 [Apodospora peruviana]